MRSAAGHQHTLKRQHKCQQHDNRVQRQFTYIINTQLWKENRRKHCKWFARLDFWRRCVQLMTSRNTMVCRYHSIFRRYIIVVHFLLLRIPNYKNNSNFSTTAQCSKLSQGRPHCHHRFNKCATWTAANLTTK